MNLVKKFEAKKYTLSFGVVSLNTQKIGHRKD